MIFQNLVTNLFFFHNLSDPFLCQRFFLKHLFFNYFSPNTSHASNFPQTFWSKHFFANHSFSAIFPKQLFLNIFSPSFYLSTSFLKHFFVNHFFSSICFAIIFPQTFLIQHFFLKHFFFNCFSQTSVRGGCCFPTTNTLGSTCGFR